MKEKMQKAKEKGIFEIVSIIVTFIIFLFNLFVGIYYASKYNFAISFYLVLLGIFRLIVFIFKKKNVKLTKFKFIILSICLICINLVLIGPIVLMVFQERKIGYGTIIAVSLATYTAYKTVMGIMNLAKSTKSDSLYYKLLSFINFIDVLVSLITLSYSLIVVNNNGELGSDSILMISVAWTTFGVIILATILFIIFGSRYFKNSKEIKDE